MAEINRIYLQELLNHFNGGPEMAFISGPRQVGKTTVARKFQSDAFYLNWDNEDHRRLIITGPKAVAEALGLRNQPTIIFDEIHKNPHWKIFLKGFYDTYGNPGGIRIIVTGSARLDIYRKGGDSLMGRYFMYRMHPLSVAELASGGHSSKECRSPVALPEEQWIRLIQFGGFPQPFLRGTRQFSNRWKRTRLAQVFREDIHDIARVQEVGLVEMLAELIALQAGQLTSYTSLANRLRVSQDSIRRWLVILQSLYYCFPVRPWHANIARSLRKEPKYFLWDWAMVNDSGARHENMVACHLFKAVQFWTDCGIGDFGLYFLRTKDKREVDFLVCRDNTPWFLVEVKSSDSPLNKNLEYFQKAVNAKHAFQVTMDAKFVDSDCFAIPYPVKVPARTFLSQLV